jgi:hypothetical protein
MFTDRDNKTAPLLDQQGIVLSLVKLWVLAMLRPEAGAVRGCGPAASGEFDRACAHCPGHIPCNLCS